MKTKRKEQKNQKGITLVALVVTIVVLIILAVISVQAVFSDSGIIKQAEKAAAAQANAEASDSEAMGEFEQHLINAMGGNGGSSGSGEENPTETPEDQKDPTEPPTQTNYLVDVVEIGDYVDIGISYKDKGSFDPSNNTTTTVALEGWRVLSKNGSGETGSITLVSASCPLTFWHDITPSTTITELADLNKKITIAISGEGFRENGFSSNNLDTVFSASTAYIDTSKGIHALGAGSAYDGIETTGEIETAYKNITGTTKTMTQLNNTIEALKTVNIQTVSGNNWKESYTDLLGIGENYWLGGVAYDSSSLWVVEQCRRCK